MFESKFDELMKSYGIIQEKNEPDLQSYNHIPTPGTEITIKPEAVKHPFVKSRGTEFQENIKNIVADNKKKTRKYRLLISQTKPIRNGAEYTGEGTSPMGYTVTIIKQTGPVHQGHFELPLELVEVVNAEWNQNGADVPEEWYQNMEKYGKFADAIKGYWVDGRQPVGAQRE